ncbi:hypothetical protein LC653_42960 [Nostoc sp. CHAB 5784]|uniref:hypothetical protein n=1 Tax=Nostoc mirabile TaxID=2907820 RepID=UPI001E5ADCC3|nr:hypothetical protein [Nostoc mirabile]MCC5670371.1 hypothetical protein [Nostoc mirabile CHAB5784]
MTYPKYTQQALSPYKLPRLKRIATELGVTPTGDKRAAQTWINAIITCQSNQLHKVTDEQALAQAELNNYIADQAQAVAPEPLRIVEISFDHHEYYADDKLVASISHDDNHLTQRWVVMVNSKEVFRANTLMRCDRFICTHYKDGTLLVEAEVQGSRGAEGKNLQQLSPLPLRSSAPMLSSSTENRIMAHIFNECQNYGFEILDNGIYNNNSVKLGQVGCTDRNWWVKKGCSGQQQYSNSVFDAVRSLSMVDTSLAEPVHKYLQDRPLEQLSSNELQQLFNYEVRSQLQELVKSLRSNS